MLLKACSLLLPILYMSYRAVTDVSLMDFNKGTELATFHCDRQEVHHNNGSSMGWGCMLVLQARVLYMFQLAHIHNKVSLTAPLPSGWPALP